MQKRTFIKAQAHNGREQPRRSLGKQTASRATPLPDIRTVAHKLTMSPDIDLLSLYFLSKFLS